jgi:hypothetical protein
MPDSCGHQCSLLRQGLCVGCLDDEKNMKVTFALFPKGSPMVVLTIIYESRLDPYKLNFGGFLDNETNTAFVNWDTLKIFKDGETKDKKIAFGNLKSIEEQGKYLQLKGF